MRKLLLLVFLAFITNIYANNNFKYVMAISGLRLRESPAIKSNTILTIPYNEKVEIIEEKNDIVIFENIKGKWAKIKYQTYIGWSFDGFLSKTDNLNYNENIKQFLISYEKLVNDKTKIEILTWYFPGGDMPPAEMHFFSNGLLIVDSEIFSPKKEKYYFLYSFSENKNRLKIFHCDRRIDFKSDDLLETNQSYLGKDVSDINADEKSVTYNSNFGKGITFYNWVFSENKKF